MPSYRDILPASRLAALAVGLSLTAHSALAQTRPPTKPAPVIAPVPAAAPPVASADPTQPPHQAGDEEISGFRSARFGMTEAELRDAIVRDFGVKPEAIRSTENAAERTHVLLVTVPDLLPGGGKAELSYVLGYTTHRLIQIGIAWSKAIDDSMTPELLASDGNTLRTYFLGRGFAPDTVTTDAAVPGGLMLFRGSDAKGRTAMLILRGDLSGEGQHRTLTPSSLVLYYLADPKNPDVFRLAPGSF
jgi:hypothetical protein